MRFFFTIVIAMGTLAHINAQEVGSPYISEKMIDSIVQKALAKQQPMLPVRIWNTVNTAYDMGKLVLFTAAIGGVAYGAYGWYADVQKFKNNGMAQADEDVKQIKIETEKRIDACEGVVAILDQRLLHLTVINSELKKCCSDLQKADSELERVENKLRDTKEIDTKIVDSFKQISDFIAQENEETEKELCNRINSTEERIVNLVKSLSSRKKKNNMSATSARVSQLLTNQRMFVQNKYYQ
ncbi:MAG: hypothetical protein WCE21_03375 [Candidatus Babeliales bacterium]